MREKSNVRIFLAHASEDKPQVRELYRQLQEAGYRPWLDEEDLLPGQEWRVEIPKEIAKSDLFIACLSQKSIAKRGYIQREYRYALDYCTEKLEGDIYLIPLKFDNCEIPDGVALRNYHWVDYGRPDGFEKLIRAIEYQRAQLEPSTSASGAPTSSANQPERSPQPQAPTSPSQSDLDSLRKQLQRARRIRDALREQKAGYGLRVPVDLVLELEEAEAKVAQLEADIERLGSPFAPFYRF